MQEIQDKYKTQVELMDQPFESLYNDTEGALQAKQEVQAKLDNLRNLDYNDPNNRESIFKTIQEVRNEYSPQGRIGLYQAKVQQYNTEMERLNKVGEKDPVKAAVLKKRLQHDAQDSDRAIQVDPETGQYINTSITPLDDWQHKDLVTTIGEYSKLVMMDAGILPTDWEGTNAEAVQLYKSGTINERTKEKLDAALYHMIKADTDLQMSAQAISENSRMDTDEFNFWTPAIDADGNPILDPETGEQLQTWNPNTLLGQAAEGVAEARVESNIDLKVGTVTDQMKIDKAKYERENPPPLLMYKEGDPLKYGTNINSSSAVSTNINDTESALRSEYIKLLQAEGQSPENATKIAMGSSFEDMQFHVNTHRGGKLAGLTDTFDALYSQRTNLNLLNKEADDYATKITGGPPKTDLIKPAQGLTVEESAFAYAKGSATGLINPEVSDAENTRLISLYEKVYGRKPETYENGKITSGERQNLSNKVWEANGLTGAASTDPAAKQLNAYSDYTIKYNNSKDQYLEDNATERQKENKVANKNLILEEVQATDSNGTPLFNPDGSPMMITRVNDKDSDRINKQVDDYFVEGNFNSIVTTIPDGTGFYTLEEYRAAKQASATKEDPNAKVTVGKPWYANYSTTTTNEDGSSTTMKPMYVDVGGEPVMINQNSIAVNYGQGTTSLGQLNSTPAAQTETWLANTSSYGVRDKPVNVGGGYTAHVKNAKTAGNYANNSDLQVDILDANGNPAGPPLVGQKAFNYLTDLQREGLLK